MFPKKKKFWYWHTKYFIIISKLYASDNKRSIAPILIKKKPTLLFTQLKLDEKKDVELQFFLKKNNYRNFFILMLSKDSHTWFAKIIIYYFKLGSRIQFKTNRAVKKSMRQFKICIPHKGLLLNQRYKKLCYDIDVNKISKLIEYLTEIWNARVRLPVKNRIARVLSLITGLLSIIKHWIQLTLLYLSNHSLP